MRPHKPPYPPRASLVTCDDSQPAPSAQSLKLPGDYYIPPAYLPQFLKTNLEVSRLSNIFSFLWFAGRPCNVRPLHRQRLFQRSIIITEQADLHLVWYDNQIYIKPLPPFLLCY